MNIASILTEMNTASIFFKVYNGRTNVVTPTVISYGSLDNNKFLYEISRGDGIFDRASKIYGVTILELDNDEYKPNYELSAGVFDSMEEALQYITELKERSK